MNAELAAFLIPAISIGIGYLFGRYERKDSYTRTYRHGYHIGRVVGRNEQK